VATITIEYGGVSGEGATVGRAKANAMVKLARLAENYAPAVYAWRGAVAIVWATPDGAAHVVVEDTGEDARRVHTSTTSSDLDDARACALSQLWNAKRAAGDYSVPDAISAALRRPEVDKMVERAKDGDAFQAAYKAAPLNVIGETGRHEWACRNAYRFRVGALP
jgi:hypothetical protein